MSDNGVPAWATALLETMNARFDRADKRMDQLVHRIERMETAVDRNTAAVRNMTLRMTVVEHVAAAAPAAASAQSSRVDDLEERLVYIEKRLDLREGGAA